MQSHMAIYSLLGSLIQAEHNHQPTFSLQLGKPLLTIEGAAADGYTLGFCMSAGSSRTVGLRIAALY